MDDFAKVNAVYATYFKEPYPARACFEVARLPKGFVFKNDIKKSDRFRFKRPCQVRQEKVFKGFFFILNKIKT